MNYSQEQIDILRLYRSDNVGPITFFNLINHYGSASATIANMDDLSKYSKKSKQITIFSEKQAEKELKQLHDIGGQMLFYDMAHFPQALLEIADPPPLLSVLGNHDILSHQHILAIIGARNASSNALALAKRFAQVMGKNGYIITSGMALGIDGAAHQGALNSDNATIAVLAGGVDHIYPKQHDKLYHDIIANGVVISEMPFSMNAQARHFPRRNRIVSGLSLGVLVIEASLKSGSLITARLANEQNREVFAVPASPLTANGRGCNYLIKQGAYLTETPDDIMPTLAPLANHSFGKKPTISTQTSTKTITTASLNQDKCDDLTIKLRQLLSHEATTIDQLMRDCDASIHEIKTALMALSLAGEVVLLPGEQVCLQSDDQSLKTLF